MSYPPTLPPGTHSTVETAVTGPPEYTLGLALVLVMLVLAGVALLLIARRVFR